MKLTVEVTQEDIRTGIRCKIEECPIALAVRRLGYNAQVGRTHCFLVENGRDKYVARLPDEAFSFRSEFDRGVLVDPLIFELEFEAY